MKTTLLITILLSAFSYSTHANNGAGPAYDQTSDGDNATQFIIAIEAAGAKESIDAQGNVKVELTNLVCPTVYELRTIAGLKGCTFTQSSEIIVALEPSVTILNNFQISQVHGTITVGSFAHFSFNQVVCNKSAQSSCTFTFNQ